VKPGEQISFHLSSDVPGQVSFTIERIGRPVSMSYTANLSTQGVPANNAWEGFVWAAVDPPFQVPDTCATGLYSLTYMDGGTKTEALAFVVLPSTPGSASKILLHISFLTPHAYNNAGGKSLYGFNSQPNRDEGSRASRVSFDRPFLQDGSPVGEPGRERPLIEWLESDSIGIPVEYCSSLELHTISDLLSSYECLVLAGHDEYWTGPMRDQVERFVAGGGNVIVLLGNTCYRQVRLEEDNRMVVFYKYAGADPVNGYDTTVAFAEPPLNLPQNQMIGVGFTAGAFQSDPRAVPAAYSIRFPQHWVFRDVPAASQGPPETKGFMVYETDAAAFVEDDDGYPRVTGEESTPLSFVVLASADLRSWTGKPGWATMGIFSRNGTVFTTGTTDWVTELGDPSIEKITLNVFEQLRNRTAWGWVPIDDADGGTAMAALGDRLFLAGSGNRLWRRYPIEAAPVRWRDIGEAQNVVAMAGSGDTLYAVSSDNRLWWRPAAELPDTIWTAIGTGPDTGTRALAAAAGILYAVDGNGELWKAPASRTAPGWSAVSTLTGRMPTINAMAAHSDILFASTSDNLLLRTDHDWINECGSWIEVTSCDGSVGLGCIDGMLFLATNGNRLWRLDLHGLRKP
jgi:hypothetical protein